MRIFVTGATGQLGSEMPRAFAGHDIIPGSRPDFDLTDERSVRTAIESAAPDLIIHAAAYTDVDGCERDPERAYRTNALGTRFVALAARSAGARLVAVSTDYVFDGTKGEPYREWDDPHPLSVYGRSKLAGEREALTLHDRCYVVRTSWVYSQRGRNFVKTMLRLAGERPTLTVVDDEHGGPTLAADLADAIAKLVDRLVFGVYHFSNQGSCSRFELAARAIALAGLSARVVPVSTVDYLSRYPLPATRPANSTLHNLAGAALGIELPPWEDALRRLLQRPS
ncbi:MAG: dTDP-4-dehydrorhamnose reductase [Chloroflexota bacterium]